MTGTPATVMVVEDDTPLRATLATSLHAHGYTVTEAASAEEAIVLTEQQVDHLFNDTYAFTGYQLTIDLDAQVVRTGDGREYSFDITAFRKYCLLNGFDDIGLTLRHADKIRQFEAERLAKQPWLNNKLVG